MFIEKLDTKILLLNNQHLGMVMQWEDRFYKVGSACSWRWHSRIIRPANRPGS